MERTIIAFSLMALLVLASVLIGLSLRRHSRQRFAQRRHARSKFQREARAVASGRGEGMEAG